MQSISLLAGEEGMKRRVAQKSLDGSRSTVLRVSLSWQHTSVQPASTDPSSPRVSTEYFVINHASFASRGDSRSVSLAMTAGHT